MIDKNNIKKIRCFAVSSGSQFVGVRGRFSVPIIKDDGIIRLVDFDGGGCWFDLQVDPADLKRVIDLACDGMGSLLVDVGINRSGFILDSVDDLVWDEKGEQWVSNLKL